MQLSYPTFYKLSHNGFVLNENYLDEIFGVYQMYLVFSYKTSNMYFRLCEWRRVVYTFVSERTLQRESG